MRKLSIFLGIFAAVFGMTAIAQAVQITVPSAPSSNYTLLSSGPGLYSSVPLSALGIFGWPFPGNATSTTLTFSGGIMATASSTMATTSLIVQDRGGQVYNAKVFGALGDGSTDDTAAINRAITRASAMGGGTVYIPNSASAYMINADYATTGSILCKNNVNILMDASTTLQEITSSANPSAIIYCLDVTHVTIKGGILVGDRYTDPNNASTTVQQGFGIDIKSSSDIRISDIHLRDFMGDGVYVSDDGDVTKPSTNIYIDNINSSNNRRQGLSGINWNGGAITNSVFTGTNGVDPQAGIDFESNFSTQSTTRVTVANNQFTSNTGGGIELNLGAIGNIITGNTIYNNQRNGILLTNTAQRNVVSGNNISNNNQSGSTYNNISLQGSASDNSIAANLITNTSATLPVYNIQILTSNNTGNALTNNIATTSGSSGDVSDTGVGTIRNDYTQHTLFNTTDRLTNYEKTLMGWTSNEFDILTQKGGTGTGRNMRIGTVSRRLLFSETCVLGCFQFNNTTNSAITNLAVGGSYSNTTATATVESLAPTISQSGDASYALLSIAPTETTLGSNQSYLMRVGTSTNLDLFNVTNAGNVGIGTSSPFALLSVNGNVFVNGNATTTNFYTATASTTNFFGAGLAVCQSGNVLTYDGNGKFGCATDQTGAGGGVWPFTTGQTNFGVAVQSTSTPEWFTNGVHASSTSQFLNLTAWGNITLSPSNNNQFVGNSANNGIRFDGSGTYGATLNSTVGTAALLDTDNNTAAVTAFFVGKDNVDPDSATHLVDFRDNGTNGFGTSTPFGLISLAALSSNTAPLVTISTSTSAATTTVFQLDSNGLLTVRSLKSLSCLGTDANGLLGAGTCSNAWPWTVATNFGTTTNATTTGEWFKFGIYASSTSQFDYASTTQLSATSLCLTADTCRTTWPSAGAGVWPFTPSTNFGVAVQSTSTPEWFTAGLHASSTSQLVNANIWGNLGIGSSTPWGNLSMQVAPSAIPAIAVATSTAPESFIFGVWATSTALATNSIQPFGRMTSDSWARVGIGTATSYNSTSTTSLLDQLTVNGRINTEDWMYEQCYGGPSVNQTTNASHVCGDWNWNRDSTGGQMLSTSATSQPYISFTNGNAATANDGAALTLGNSSGFFGTLGTTTPVIEVNARIAKPTATGTTYYIGFTDQGVGAVHTAPTAGCFFTASTTQTNWIAVCANGGAQTLVDTGFASSTSLTVAGSFYRFRLEADAIGATFYMGSRNVALKPVARITTNYAPTTAIQALVAMAWTTGAAASTKQLDIQYTKLWAYDPPL